MPHDNETQDTNLLGNFQFDDDVNFFGIGEEKKSKTDVSTVVTQAKAGTTVDEPEEVDENETATSLDDDINKVKENKITVEKEKPKPTTVKKEEEVREEVTTTKKKPEEEKEEPKFFEEETKTGKSKVAPNKEEVVEDDDPEFFTSLAVELKEKGVLQNVEIPKDKKLTEDEFFELQDEEIEARVAENLEAFIEDMDDDAKAFIKFKKKGGSTKEFVETYYGSGIDYDNFDPKDEVQREALIRYYVTNHENLDSPEDIEDRIQSIKDSGKAEAKAEQWAGKLKKIDETNKAELDKKIDKQQKERIEANKKFNESLVSTINKTDKIGAFSITKEDQKELAKFITTPTIKVGKDRSIPAFQSELAKILRAETKEDKENLILLAKLVKNKFDVSDLVPKIQTEVTRRVNNTLRRTRTESVQTGSGLRGKRVLADAFGDED